MAEEQFGELLREWRERAGLTQEALGRRAGVRTNTVQELETQPGRRPRTSTLNALSDALRLTPEDRRIFVSRARRRRAETAGAPASAPDRGDASGPAPRLDATRATGPDRPAASRRRRQHWLLTAVAAVVVVSIVAIDVGSQNSSTQEETPGSRVEPSSGVLAASQSPFLSGKVQAVGYNLQDWPSVKENVRVGRGEITLLGQDYVREMYYLDGFIEDFGYITFQLGGQCTALQGLTGMTDGSPSESRGEILVYVDGAVRLRRSLRPATAEKMAIDLRGAMDLRVAFRATTAVEDGRSVLVDPVLTCVRT